MKKASIVVVVSLMFSMVTYGQSCGNDGNDRVIKGANDVASSGAKITVKGGSGGTGGSILLMPGGGAGQSGNVGIGGQYGMSFGNWGTNSPDATPDAQLVLSGAFNTGYNMGTKLLIEGIDNEYNHKAISVVDENSNELFYLQSTPVNYGQAHFKGNVGIGTTEPEAILEVYGGHATAKEKIKIGNLHIGPNLGPAANYTRWYLGYNMYWNGTWSGGKWVGTDEHRSIFINDNTTLRFIIGMPQGQTQWDHYTLENYTKFSINKLGNGYFAGNVGIGTDDPGSYRLAVNGHIRTKEITVESDWSDFVFEDNYQLMPLDKLEKHIKEEKSLPGIPKEKEVTENGVNLGEMQAKLLEKVEELTLYVIDLKKENEELKERIDALEN